MVIKELVEEMLTANIIKPSCLPFAQHTRNFGLKNSPALFQRLMEITLVEVRGNICFVYLNDLIIYSPSREQHFRVLQEVFKKLREARLFPNFP